MGTRQTSVLHYSKDIEIVSTRVSERRYANECSELDFKSASGVKTGSANIATAKQEPL